MSRVVLVAAGGLARETISSIRQTGDHEVAGILDDDASRHGGDIGGVRVLGGLDRAADMSERLLICAGLGLTRARIVSRLEMIGVRASRYATHVDAAAVVGDRVSIGEGSIVLAGCVLTSDISLGAHVVLMPRVVLTHDDRVGDFATLTAGAAVGGRVTIGRCAYIGMNASVRQDLTVGEQAVLGMGGVLVRDLPDGQTWAGNPAGPLASHTLSRSGPARSAAQHTERQEAWS